MHLDFPDVMTIRQLAKRLKISQQTIQLKIKTGELLAYKSNGSWQISKHAALDWLSQQKSGD